MSFSSAWISLTYSCNNRCPWCYANSNNSSKIIKQFNFKKISPVVNLLKKLDVKHVTLIGGEPTLYSHLILFIKKLKQKNISVGMVTNGRRFKDKEFVKQVCLSGLDSVTFSIEGYDSSSHDTMTGVPNSFYQTIQGIQNSIDAGIPTSTNTLISSKNLNDLKKVILLLSKYKLRSITFNVCGVCLSEEQNNSFLISPSNAAHVFEKLDDFAKSISTEIQLTTPVPLCNFSSDFRLSLNKNWRAGGGPCHAVSGKSFVLDYNGDIVPCTHLAGYSLFNIFEKGVIISPNKFLKKYFSPKEMASKFRDKISYYPSSKCNRKNCQENCSGGCPLLWIKFNPENQIKGILKTIREDKQIHKLHEEAYKI